MKRQGGEDRAVYIISVAAELAGVHPQTLRIYERKGLLRPARTAGNTRRYSERDIDRLRMIQRLTQEQGLNLAGVKMIVQMEDEIDRMRLRMETMDRELQRARRRMREEIERLRRESRRAEIVPLSSVPRLRIRMKAEPERRGPFVAGPGS
jgi:MerR family transcriptional regulator/heat shock protein HspR